jgi:hypothetical protein
MRIRGFEVESIEQSTTVSRVPGSPLAMALVRGQIVPVLMLGDAKGSLVVGRVRGEVVGIAGLEVVDLEFSDASESNDASLQVDPAARGQACRGPFMEGLCDEQVIDVEAVIAANRLKDRSLPQP